MHYCNNLINLHYSIDINSRNRIGSKRRASILLLKHFVSLNLKNSHLWQVASQSLESELKYWGCLEEVFIHS